MRWIALFGILMSAVCAAFNDVKIVKIQPAPWPGMFEIVTDSEIVHANASPPSAGRLSILLVCAARMCAATSSRRTSGWRASPARAHR